MCTIYQGKKHLKKIKFVSKNVDALAKLYEHVDDVDYYAAGLLEKRKPGSILGHTFQCIVGEMFFRWKFGDRFYYEFGNQPGSFGSGTQLNNIVKFLIWFERRNTRIPMT